MKNISHFLNFTKFNAPVVQWFASITQLAEARSLFCDIAVQNNEMGKNKIIENGENEDFAEHHLKKGQLPLNLQSSFGCKYPTPVFNIDEALSSDKLFNEILNTDLILLNCPVIDKQKGIKLDALSSKIINHAKCPVLFIPENVKSGDKLNKIVISSDLRFTELRLLRTMARTAKSLKSSLTLAHTSNKDVPDLNIDYGKNLFENSFARTIYECKITMENLRRLDIQKYPDLIHEFLLGDIYAMFNKNTYRESDYIESPAVTFAAIAKKPLLLINS